MTGRRFLLLMVIACAVAGGCAKKPEDPGPPSPERVQQCLSGRDGVADVKTIDTGQSHVSTLPVKQERALRTALKPSEAAINAISGGPVERDGAIADGPVGATELHFFPNQADAQHAADAVEPVVGSPDDSLLNGVRVLGPVLVVHYSYGMGDSPGGIGIEEDIEPVEACLREVGYLQS